jgi:hypothetical protein
MYTCTKQIWDRKEKEKGGCEKNKMEGKTKNKATSKNTQYIYLVQYAEKKE